mmetsp:Transcript_6912/g.10562  ORF Transcript_6912/g.10562 Transcript_6912/m.10562 type:complete len:139 (-) Transcript_6912:49-465(-)
MANLFGGNFVVTYILRPDRTMTSHAKCNFPQLLFFSSIQNLYLSVSGTYDTEDGSNICRVDFDNTWVRQQQQDDDDDQGPYETLQSVPDSPTKNFIQTVGRWLFIRQFSVFPISFLDNDLIVFDFELLGTRICAKKQQ